MKDNVKHVRPCCAGVYDGNYYFGEFDTVKGANVPKGTGLWLDKSGKRYVMCEDASGAEPNGWYFERHNGTGMTYAGQKVNGKDVGYHLQFDCSTKKGAYVACARLNAKGEPDGFMITVTRGDDYYITQIKDGKETGNVLHFREGRFFAESKGKLGVNVLNAVDCGWGYQFPTFGEGATYFSRANQIARPAYVRNFYDAQERRSTYEYVGGVMCWPDGGKLSFQQDGNDHRRFTNEPYGFGIVPSKNGDFYFGGIAPDGKQGEFYRDGLGFLRVAHEMEYLGEFNCGRYHGAALIKDGNKYLFRCYSNGKPVGVQFTFHDDMMFINRATGDDKVSYSLYYDDFRFCEISNGEFHTVANFENYNLAALSKKIPAKDRINPLKLQELDMLGLKYRVTDELDIIVTGTTRKDKELVQIVPGFVAGIDKKAFAGNKNLVELILESGVRFISGGAFSGCFKLKDVKFSDTLDVIEGDSFDGTAVEGLVFPKGVKLIKNYAFTGCKKLRWASICGKDCNVEPHAFPEWCKVTNKELTEEELERLRREREENVAKIVEELKAKKAAKEGKKEGKEPEKPKKVKKVKERDSDGSRGIVGVMLGILSAIAGVILFIPGAILKLFRIPKKWETPFAVCVATLFVGALTLILGFLGALSPIEDFMEVLANETVPGLFGFRLTEAYSGLVNSVMESNGFFGVILTILYAVVAPFNLLLNVGVLALVIATYAVYIVYGILFIYGLGAVLVGASIFGIVTAKDKTFPVLTLIISIAISVVYYLSMGAFYPI